MYWRLTIFLSLLLTPFSELFAQAGPGAVPSFGQMMGKMLPMFVMVFFIFYFMVLKPQQQKIDAQKKLLESLKKGDDVATTGGIVGRVFSVEKDHVVLEIANSVRVRFEPIHVIKRFGKEEKGS